MFTINTQEIAQAIKKLFGIKRFANIEFSARHAFENLDVAMIFLQCFLLVTACIMAFYLPIRYLRYRRKKKIATILQLVTHIRSSLELRQEINTVQQASQKQLEMKQKEAYDTLQLLLKKRRIKKLLGIHYTPLLVAVNYAHHHMPTKPEYLRALDRAIELFETLLY